MRRDTARSATIPLELAHPQLLQMRTVTYFCAASVSPSPPTPPSSPPDPNPHPPPPSMSFEDYLQLLLDPSQQLPRQLDLGRSACSWSNGKWESKGELQPGFMKLTAYELRQIMRKLQAEPHEHVVFLNLDCQEMGMAMMRELAVPVAALKALQVLILASTFPPCPHCL
jgi:hypothetical protein